jgi:hypothetical protein
MSTKRSLPALTLMARYLSISPAARPYGILGRREWDDGESARTGLSVQGSQATRHHERSTHQSLPWSATTPWVHRGRAGSG